MYWCKINIIQQKKWKWCHSFQTIYRKKKINRKEEDWLKIADESNRKGRKAKRKI